MFSAGRVGGAVKGFRVEGDTMMSLRLQDRPGIGGHLEGFANDKARKTQALVLQGLTWEETLQG